MERFCLECVSVSIDGYASLHFTEKDIVYMNLIVAICYYIDEW